MKQSKELQAAVEAAKEASKIALKHFGKPHKVDIKPSGSRVSAIDILCQDKIIEVLKKRFPDYGILSEEGVDQQEPENTWIIDPIDGTHNYLHSIPFFGTQIALKRNSEIVAGVIIHPALNEIFVAERGKGALLNGKPIHVSKADKLASSMILKDVMDPKYLEQSIEIYKRLSSFSTTAAYDLRLFGAGNMDTSFVARGCGDAWVSYSAHSWDVAPGKIIIEEAGGRVTDFDGNNSHSSPSIIASNGLVHDELIELLRDLEEMK